MHEGEGGLTPTLDAIVFDFDGLIVDTEWSVYLSISEVYAEHGHELDMGWWRSIVGTDGGYDWLERLEGLVGRRLDAEAIRRRRTARHHEIIAAMAPMPGLVGLLAEAAAAGVALAVASSSPTEWVVGHLERLGLREPFEAICGSDTVGGVAKPAPDVYLAAIATLDAAPHRAVALEDSPHGVAAAKAAGLGCVAVPNRITAPGDFSSADLVVGSLTELNVADLGRRFGGAVGSPA